MTSIETIIRRRCGTIAAGELFAPGGITITDTASTELARLQVQPADLVRRHCAGDWTEMLTKDRQHNLDALAGGGRIFSSYRLNDRIRVWIVTEADRCSTTIMLPGEY